MDKNIQSFRYFYNLLDDPCRGNNCRVIAQIIFLDMAGRSRKKLIQDVLNESVPLEGPVHQPELKRGSNGGLLEK